MTHATEQLYNYLTLNIRIQSKTRKIINRKKIFHLDIVLISFGLVCFDAILFLTLISQSLPIIKV